MTRGRAATPDPFDLGAVTGSDELVEALSTRRFADLDTASADDPAAALLAALVADIDAGAPPLPPRTRVTRGVQSTKRRGVRAVVTFGVAALVLTSAGAAAAGGGSGGIDVLRPPHGAVRHKATERSNENTQRHANLPEPASSGRRSSVPRTDAGTHHADAADAQPRSTDDKPLAHRSRQPSRTESDPPPDVRRSPSSPSPAPSWGPQTPSPTPDGSPMDP